MFALGLLLCSALTLLHFSGQDHDLGDTFTPEILLRIIGDLLETEVVGLTVAEVLENLLDVEVSVSEECLHLAVSTPVLPGEKEEQGKVGQWQHLIRKEDNAFISSKQQEELLPVLFFIYGGGFIAGTQMKMGYERLGEANDFVLVAVNYRLGPLGKT